MTRLTKYSYAAEDYITATGTEFERGSTNLQRNIILIMYRRNRGGFLSIAVQILANWGFGLSPGEWTMLPSSPSLLRPAVSI